MRWDYTKEISLSLPTTATGQFLGMPVTINLTPTASAGQPATINGGFRWKCKQKVGSDFCDSEMRDPRKIRPRVTRDFTTTPYQSANIAASSLNTLTSALPNAPTVTIGAPTIRWTPEIDVIPNGQKCFRVYPYARLEYNPGSVTVSVNIPVPTFGNIPITSTFNIGSQIDTWWEAGYSICCCDCQRGIPEYDERRDGEHQPLEDPWPEHIDQCAFDHSVAWAEDQQGSGTSVNWKITANEGPCCRRVIVATEREGTQYRTIPGSKTSKNHST